MKISNAIVPLLLCQVLCAQAEMLEIDCFEAGSDLQVLAADSSSASYSVRHLEDLDLDGLTDTVQIDFDLRTSAELVAGAHHSFGVGSSDEIAKGESLTVKVTSVSYTLATGKEGQGSFAGFTGITLANASKVRVNRRLQQNTAQHYDLKIDTPEITIQPALFSRATGALTGLTVSVAVRENEVATQEQSHSIPGFMLGVGPLLLLLFRKKEPTANNDCTSKLRSFRPTAMRILKGQSIAALIKKCRNWWLRRWSLTTRLAHVYTKRGISALNSILF